VFATVIAVPLPVVPRISACAVPATVIVPKVLVVGCADWRACLAIDLADSTSLVSEVRPWSAADSVCWAWPIESSSEFRSLARLLSELDVK
jgi:hypothetical protein